MCRILLVWFGRLIVNTFLVSWDSVHIFQHWFLRPYKVSNDPFSNSKSIELKLNIQILLKALDPKILRLRGLLARIGHNFYPLLTRVQLSSDCSICKSPRVAIVVWLPRVVSVVWFSASVVWLQRVASVAWLSTTVSVVLFFMMLITSSSKNLGRL